MGEPERQKHKLFLALPNYGNLRYNTVSIITALTGPKSFDAVAVAELHSSLLAYGFNTLWAQALAQRKKGITHFLMLHADVVPHEVDWLVQLHREMVRVGAQVLSAVIPMKDTRGFTSTAIDGEPLRQFTMQEIMTLPETFTHPDLLVNIGMLLVDMRQPWVEEICFTVTDRIAKTADGSFTALCEGEDWDFSCQARRLGVQVWATRKVKLTHWGASGFSNFRAWGTEAHDLRGPVQPPIAVQPAPDVDPSIAQRLVEYGVE
jgi:hypothetical protein